MEGRRRYAYSSIVVATSRFWKCKCDVNWSKCDMHRLQFDVRGKGLGELRVLAKRAKRTRTMRADRPAPIVRDEGLHLKFNTYRASLHPDVCPTLASRFPHFRRVKGFS